MVLRPKPRNRHSDFEAQIIKLKLSVLRPKLGNPAPPWFWGSTKKPTAGFVTKPGETIATSFEVKLEKTVAAGFEAKPPETVTTGFEAKQAKTIWVVLRPNHSQTVTIGFEAQTDEKPSEWFWGQTTGKPSTLDLRLNQETRAPRFHVHGANRTRHHPTSRSPGHWVPNLCDHSRSSAPGHPLLPPRSSLLHAMLHLPPAHHETSKHDSPNKTKIKEKQNETIPDSNSNLTKSMTHHNQTMELTTWFLRNPTHYHATSCCQWSKGKLAFYTLSWSLALDENHCWSSRLD
jgi:hypothetical protein